MVTAAAHVIAVLEQIENGLLEDVTAIEPYACEGGCFGSPLLFEDHHVAQRRWSRGEAGGRAPRRPRPRDVAAVPRRRPFAARPGIRLDADMGKAIQKLGRLQAITDLCRARTAAPAAPPPAPPWPKTSSWSGPASTCAPISARDKEDTDS